MLDLKFIRENPELVKQGLAKKYDKSDIDQVLELDNQRREIIRKVEALKAKRNAASADIAKAKKAGESAEEAIAAMKKVGEEIAGLASGLMTSAHEIGAAIGVAVFAAIAAAGAPQATHAQVADGRHDALLVAAAIGVIAAIAAATIVPSTTPEPGTGHSLH